jgi:hypothetical protein
MPRNDGQSPESPWPCGSPLRSLQKASIGQPPIGELAHEKASGSDCAEPRSDGGFSPNFELSSLSF